MRPSEEQRHSQTLLVEMQNGTAFLERNFLKEKVCFPFYPPIPSLEIDPPEMLKSEPEMLKSEPKIYIRTKCSM